MKQALGLLEVQGLSTAVVAADTMAKAANVRLLEVENTKGSGYMTIKVTGDVGAVNASVQAGRQTAIENRKLVSWKVIPRPSDYVEHTFCSPASPVSEKKRRGKNSAFFPGAGGRGQSPFDRSRSWLCSAGRYFAVSRAGNCFRRGAAGN